MQLLLLLLLTLQLLLLLLQSPRLLQSLQQQQAPRYGEKTFWWGLSSLIARCIECIAPPHAALTPRRHAAPTVLVQHSASTAPAHAASTSPHAVRAHDRRLHLITPLCTTSTDTDTGMVLVTAALWPGSLTRIATTACREVVVEEAVRSMRGKGRQKEASSPSLCFGSHEMRTYHWQMNREQEIV